ncbi:hypothetical protein HXV84_15095 [Pseudomonas amygdali pv. morsprunorum]|nr:hypothetical protein [Pseudomonas amygdali pv. morsprunorum]
MFILGLAVYVLGGIGLYYFTGHLTAAGEVMDATYAWIYLDAGVRISTYQFTCFGWSTACHACWMALFSPKGVVWVGSMRFSNVVYLFLECSVICFSVFLFWRLLEWGLPRGHFLTFINSFPYWFPVFCWEAGFGLHEIF